MKKVLIVLAVLGNLRSGGQILTRVPKTDSVKTAPSYLPSKDFTTTYITNPGFEDGLFGWKTTGTAFTQIVGGNIVSSERVRTDMLLENGGIGGDYWKNLAYPIGAKGQRWMGSFERGNGDAAVGSITSEPFKMKKRFLSFLLGGGSNRDHLYVELQVKGSSTGGYGTTADGYTRAGRITPAINSDELFRYQFDLAEITGISMDSIRNNPPTVRLSVVDSEASGPWGHLNVDDFQLSDCRDNYLKITREGKTLLADKDKPVWGFVDTHTHPMAHLAFGGKTMTGDPDGPMDVALATAQCVDNNHQPGNGLGFISIQGYNWHLPYGYPTFSGWPKFNVQLHQPMYIEWIKRSYEGGLKLICVLGVTNMFWASRALGPGVKPDLPLDDESVALNSIKQFSDLVSKNSDWMEVALTPQDARRIILSNKLAVVLGVEMDNFGNFKDQSYVYREPYPMPPSKQLEILSGDTNTARKQIKQKIDDYFKLGVRQVTPLHYISGLFGGTAVFRYQFGMIQSAFTGKPYLLNEGRFEGVNYNLTKDIQAFQAIMGSAWEYLSGDVKAFYTCDPAGLTIPDPLNPRCESRYSTVNGQGMFIRGTILYDELMKRGLVIDVDHASHMTSAQLFRLADKRKYPLLSSHSDPAETCLGPNPYSFAGNWIQDNHESNYKNYGTTIIGNLSTEMTPQKKYYQDVAKSGGMAGLFTFPFRKTNNPIFDKSVPNDCDGSSKSWAQNYLYAIQTMPGKGIGLATDKGFTEGVGPRFGAFASYKLMEEENDYLKQTLRRQQRMAQDNAVEYDIPFQDWNPRRYEMGKMETFEDGIFEEDLLKALAFWTTHPQLQLAKPADNPEINNVPPSQFLFQTDRVRNLVIGLSMTDAANLIPTGVFSGADQPWQQAITYCFSHNTLPGNLPRDKYAGDYLNLVQQKYERWKPVYDLWMRMLNGKNEPLRKLVNGNRDWDYNLDGMAHYGMIPDFIQDLKNVGIRSDQMIPLFSSAEEYIRMWEKADSASGSKENCSATASTIKETGCNYYTSPSGKYKWTSSGTYKDTLLNTSCCDSVITINLTIRKVDTAVLAQSNILTASAQNASFQWINCTTREEIPNATAATLSTGAGNYAVIVTQSGCSATSSCYSITPLVVTPPVKTMSLPVQKYSGARKLVAGDRKNNSEFGKAVSISGNYAVIGVPYERTDVNDQNEMTQSGAVYVFEKNSDSTWKQIQKIVPSDRTPGDHFGWSVAISGNNFVAGAVYDREDDKGNNMGVSAGSAYIFEKQTNGTWAQVKKLGPTPWDSYSYFGDAVAIEGNTIVVGAIGHSRDTTNDQWNGYVGDAGALFVYEGSGSNWEFKQKLIAKDRTQANHGEGLGNKVSISGNYIIAGATGSGYDVNNANNFVSAGAAYIFERIGSKWTAVQKLVASDRSPYDEFGYAVAISGDNAIVGARRTTLLADENSNSYTGTAYIFSRSQSGNWNEVLKVIPDDRKPGDLLGSAVAIHGDYAVVGSPQHQVTNPGDGAVYVYWLNGEGKWTLIQKLSSTDHGSYAGMGESVGISDKFVIAGARIEHRDLLGNNELSNAGAVYIFEKPTGLKTMSELPANRIKEK